MPAMPRRNIWFCDRIRNEEVNINDNLATDSHGSTRINDNVVFIRHFKRGGIHPWKSVLSVAKIGLWWLDINDSGVLPDFFWKDAEQNMTRVRQIDNTR